MQNFIKVRFHELDPIRWVVAPDEELKSGDVIVFDYDGDEDIGVVDTIASYEGEGDKFIRKASLEDLTKWERVKLRAKEILAFSRETVYSKGLDVRIVDSHLTLSEKKVEIFYLATKKVDLKGLARSVGKNFKVRVRLRAIGPREAAQKMGGFGLCGRRLCCATFLKEFQLITLQGVKLQNIFASADKLTGLCGRLMCCLGFEKDFYEEVMKDFPQVGEVVYTPYGRGEVLEVRVFQREVKVKLENNRLVNFAIDDIKRGGRDEATGTESRGDTSTRS